MSDLENIYNAVLKIPAKIEVFEGVQMVDIEGCQD